jgi:hypothetical protein
MSDPTIVSIISTPLPYLTAVAGMSHTFPVVGNTKYESNYIQNAAEDPEDPCKNVLQFQQGPIQDFTRRKPGQPRVIKEPFHGFDLAGDCEQEILALVDPMAEMDIDAQLKQIVGSRADRK